MLKTMLFFAEEVQAFQNFESFKSASAIAVVLCKQSQWLQIIFFWIMYPDRLLLF